MTGDELKACSFEVAVVGPYDTRDKWVEDRGGVRGEGGIQWVRGFRSKGRVPLVKHARMRGGSRLCVIEEGVLLAKGGPPHEFAHVRFPRWSPP